MSESFNNIQSTTSVPISDGATALKLEDEVNLNNSDSLNETQYSENINESDLSNGHSITENLQETPITENHHVEAQEIQVDESSNGLENFGLQEEGSFELFDNTDEKQSSLEQDEKETEEDELEIPAFLRRQKN
jgi:cell division protein FtsZ